MQSGDRDIKKKEKKKKKEVKGLEGLRRGGKKAFLLNVCSFTTLRLHSNYLKQEKNNVVSRSIFQPGNNHRSSQKLRI